MAINTNQYMVRKVGSPCNPAGCGIYPDILQRDPGLEPNNIGDPAKKDHNTSQDQETQDLPESVLLHKIFVFGRIDNIQNLIIILEDPKIINPDCDVQSHGRKIMRERAKPGDAGYGMWDVGCGMWDVGCGI
jgi:hypothetical protein